MAKKRDNSTVVKLQSVPVDPAMSMTLPPDLSAGMTFREIGQSGLRQWSGYVREEFLPNLIGRQGIRTYREMIDSSPIIGGILTAFSATLRKVEWRTEAPENGTKDQSKIDFADSLREDMSVTWEETMGETMSMLGYGFAPQEILYKKRDGYQETQGVPSSKFDDGLIGWRKIPIRGQDTVLKWFFGPNGEILGLTQQPWNASIRDVPIEKMLLFRNGVHKNNPEGRSLLRNAYRNYFFIKRIEEQEAILFERLNGLPVVRVPLDIMSAAQGGDPDSIATMAMMKKIATNLRIDEQMGVVLPSDVYQAAGGATTSSRMYDLELLTPQMSMRGVVSTDVLNRHATNIMISVMADFLNMGHTAHGTQSLAEVKTDIFLQSVESSLNSVAAIYNRYALPRVWRLNGFDPATMPDFIPDMAQRVDLDVLSNFVLRMSQAGMPLFPDEEMQSALLDIAGLPDIQDPGALSAAEASASYALEYAPPTPPAGKDPGGKPNLQKTLFGRMIMASMARRYQKLNGAETNYRGPRPRGQRTRPMRKFNPNHDELGRFDFGPGGSSAGDGSTASGFHEVSAAEFVKARDNSTRGAFLTQATEEDLKDHNLFLSEDGKVGYALDQQGDLQNLFNNGGPPGAGKAAIADAIANGATTLDAFDPYLPDLYSKFGFVPTGRVAFNRDYAPAGWDYGKYGTPDVVFMKYEGGDRSTIGTRYGTFPEYNSGSSRLYTDWDAAKSASRSGGVGKDAHRRASEDDVEGGAALRPGLHDRTLGRSARANGARANADGLGKFNPNHDAIGRFTFGTGVKASGEEAANQVKQIWVQNSDVKTLEEAFALAPEDQNKLVDDAKKAEEEVDNGTELKNPGVKGQERAGEKVDEGRPPAAVTDIVRLGFVVPEPELADQIINDLSKNYAVIDEGWNRTSAGWVDRKAYVRFDDGMIGEVQMWPPAMYNAKMKMGGLQLYTQARSMPEGPAKAAIVGQMNDLYGSAASRLSQSWKNAIGIS